MINGRPDNSCAEDFNVNNKDSKIIYGNRFFMFDHCCMQGPRDGRCCERTCMGVWR